MLKSSPALSELTQLYYALPPCPRHTHRYNNDCSCFLRMLSLCSCWVRYCPVSTGQKHIQSTPPYICTHMHISTQCNYPLFFSFSVSVWYRQIHTYLCLHPHINIVARTLWPNSPLIDVCLSVKEAQHKEQQWACVWLKGNKERSILCQFSDSSRNTAWACLSYGHT